MTNIGVRITMNILDVHEIIIESTVVYSITEFQ